MADALQSHLLYATRKMLEQSKQIQKQSKKIEEMSLLETKFALQEKRIETQEQQILLQKEQISKLETTIAITSLRLDECDKNHTRSPLSQTLFNEDLLWEISDFKNVFEDIKKTDFMLNQYMFTSEGYKLKVGLWLNGLDGGKKTHVSLYICLRPGPFDSVLEWPMRAVISVCVLKNGSEKNVRVIETNKRDFSQRSQTSIKDSAWVGYPHYIPHNQVKSFVVDDKFTLKVNVKKK